MAFFLVLETNFPKPTAASQTMWTPFRDVCVAQHRQFSLRFEKNGNNRILISSRLSDNC